MKRVLSTTTQSSSRKTSALCRQQIVILLLMTCFALALTAPTTPAASSILKNEASTEDIDNVVHATSTEVSSTSLEAKPITAEIPFNIVNRLNGNNEQFLPVPKAASSDNLDTITKASSEVKAQEDEAEPATTTSENLIGTKSFENGAATTIHSSKYDNGIIKIHEPIESEVESSPSTSSQMPSAIKSDLSDVMLLVRERGPPSPTIETNESHEYKSISSEVKATRNGMNVDVTSVRTTFASDDFAGAPSVATTIEMPIKHDADNLKIMGNERDFTSEQGRMEQGKGEGMKKGKMKENRKKANGVIEKKQKLKQKYPMDINHPTIVPTNEPTTQLTTDKASEVYETTHEATISTSIKTVPTTIKSTTLTTIKSFHSDSETTEPFSKEKFASSSTTESAATAAMNVNEMKADTTMAPPRIPTASMGPTVTANEQQSHGDNVIVLNTNSSGLIVVDIMENFGTENASNNTETFEIKMDLIDDSTATTEGSHKIQEPDSGNVADVADAMQKILETNIKDDIFLTTIESKAVKGSGVMGGLSVHGKSLKIDSATTTNDDIILINESNESTTTQSTTLIKWNEVKSDEGNGNIKITFDNIDLPNQNVNVSIENGELVIDSIDISVLNKAEEELKKKKKFNQKFDASTGGERRLNKTDSLEIILIEDDSHQEAKDINRDNLSENDESNLATTSVVDKIVNDDGVESDGEGEKKVNVDDFQATTIHFEMKHEHEHHREHLKKIELSGSDEEDGIKIKTTDKDSDTVFYISNTEVKVIESIPTVSPNASQERKYYPAIYEEDVIVDVPRKNRTAPVDKYEEDIVLSPLTSDFDPKDINYIGEAFLDVEESSNVGGMENHHIIPLTSDVVIQPVQLHDMPSIGIPIIGELPPQIELEEMVFSDDYDSKQQSNFRVEEYYPNFLSNRLVKNQLEADVPREMIFDSKNGTLLLNRTHISINTMINGTNMTSPANSFPNGTAFLVESEETAENAGEIRKQKLQRLFMLLEGKFCW